MKLIFFIAILTYVHLITPALTAEKYYKWTDKEGVVHVTDDPTEVRKEHLGSVKEIKSDAGGMKAWGKKLLILVKSEKKLIGISVLVLILIFIGYKKVAYSKIVLKNYMRNRRLLALQSYGIDGMSQEEFKSFTSRLLEKRGYKVSKLSDELIAFGIDFIAKRKGTKYAVFINHQTGEISRYAVNEADREKHRFDCDSSIIITKGYFTYDAKELAARTECVIIDRDKLAEWI